jgi:predicted transcriptional regulator
MDSPENRTPADLVSLTRDVVSAYVANNSVRTGELPALITSVYMALSGLGKPQIATAERPVPAVPVKKSITPDYLISLEDGRQYKSLKRHLARRGLTPDQYRQKWGLPSDYPMVAANYAKLRAELARGIGLGRRRSAAGPAEPAVEEPARPAKKVPRRAPSKRKAGK